MTEESNKPRLDGWKFAEEWSRRDFLKTGAGLAMTLSAGPVLAACGGDSGPAASSGAAIPKAKAGAKLRLMQWTSFVPAADDEIKRQAAEFSSTNNVTVTIETVDGSQLQPKTAAAVEAGDGPDIIQMQYAWPHLYEKACLDLTDLVNALKGQLGTMNPVNEAYSKVGAKYLAVPYCQVPNAWSFRTDIWKQAGLSGFPTTLDELATAGKTLKEKGLPPIAVSLGHAYGDATSMWYPVLWGHGGREVTPDGKKVTINSKETTAALNWAIATWKAGYISQNTLSWLDPDNNQAYHSGLISATLNGASIYIKEVYKEDTKHKYAAVTDNAAMPKGPTGLFTMNLAMDHAIMKWTKDPDTAKAFLAFLMQPENYKKWLDASLGYNGSPFSKTAGADILQKDTKLKPFQDVITTGKWPGWPAQPSKQTSQSQVEFIIVDMFAKAVTSGDTKAPIADAEQKLKRIYELPG